MGQQQVLLLILVSIIVGIMTIVGINTFQANRTESNKDIIRQQVLQAASKGQMYYKKHPARGGGGGAFTGITLKEVGPDSFDGACSYSLSDVLPNSFKINAMPVDSSGELIAIVYSDKVEWE